MNPNEVLNPNESAVRMIWTEFSIRIISTSDSLGLKNFVRVHSDSKSRIKSDRFFTDLHQTRLKPFFGLARIQISKKIWLVWNKFQSETFTRVLFSCFSIILLFIFPKFVSDFIHSLAMPYLPAVSTLPVRYILFAMSRPWFCTNSLSLSLSLSLSNSPHSIILFHSLHGIPSVVMYRLSCCANFFIFPLLP